MSTVESESAASAGLPFTFHRRRKKLSEMFKGSYCNWTGVAASGLEVARQRPGPPHPGERETTLHGYYVKLDHQGRAVHSENLTVHFIRWGDGALSYTVRPHDDRKGAGLQYLWTEHGKWVKLKAVAARASKDSSEKIPQATKASGHKRKGDSCVVRWSRKGRNGYLHCPNVDVGPEGDSNEMSGGGKGDEEDAEDGDDDIVSGYDHIQMNYNIHNGRSYYHNESICYKRPGCYKRKDSYFNKSKRKRNAGERYEDSPTRGQRDIKPINCCAKNYLLGRSVASRNSKRWKQGVEAMKHESTSSSFEGCYEYGVWETYLEDGDDCGGQARPDNPTLDQFCSTDLTKRPRRGVRIRPEHVPLNDEKSSASTNDIHSANDLSLKKLHHDAVHTSSKVGGDYDKRPTDEPIGEDSVATQTGQTIKAGKRPTLPTSTQDTRGQEYVTVLLSRATTRPDCLVAEFRQDYREGACKPRRFAINISRLMYQHVILRTRLRVRAVPKLDMSTYLVFAFSGEFSSGEDEYRVWVNSAWSKSPAGQMLRSFATDRKVARIHELIEDVVRAVDEVDIKQLRARTGSLIPTEVRQRPVCLFNMLIAVARWETGSLCLPHTSEWCDRESVAHARKADSPEKILDDVMALLDEKINDFSQCTNRGPANAYLCGICLLDFSSNDRGGQPLPLALTSCSHWFCEDCWRSKVVIQLKRGQRPCHVDCPEKDCLGRMDPVTTLTLMRVHDIRRMNQFKVDNYVVTSPLVKICPNASCGRILLAKPQAQADKSTLIVTCACTRQLCFKCARAPHWPSSCEMSDRYHNLISERGDDTLTRTLLDGEFPEVVSRGKNCPKCRMFIQETNNLRFVACACGCQFCWPCGKEINGSVVPHTRCVEVFQQSDKVLKEIILNGKMVLEGAQGSRWYRTALMHRKMRHPEVVIAMYAMADAIAKSIASSAQNGRYVGDVESAVKGWGKNLAKWARENYDNLHSPNTISAPVLGHQDEDNSGSGRSPRPLTSASSNRSASSFSSDTPDSGFSIAAATCNIVQSKLELHHIVEYTSVLLSNSLHTPSRLAQSLERAEDICMTLGILLQSSSAQNPRQIIPAFLRVRRQAINTIGDIVSFLEKVPSGVFWLDEN